MTEVPENWYRVTPAVAGRRSARGIPTFIAIAAMALGVTTLFALKPFIGYWAAVGFGMLFSGSIVVAVKLLAPNDRDWFDILCELINHKFEILMMKLWERKNRW